MLRFQAVTLDEPDLVFGERNEEKDPRIGLRQFGPFFGSTEVGPSPTQVRVGIVGTGETITLARAVLEALRHPIPSRGTNRWLYPDFEGFSLQSSIRCEILTNDNWNGKLLPQEIERLVNIEDAQQRIAAAANLVVSKVGNIRAEDDHPNVVLVALPKIIEDYCGISHLTRGAAKPKLTPLQKEIQGIQRGNQGRGRQGFLQDFGAEFQEEETEELGYNLRSAIKGKVMEHGIPTQLLRESRATPFLKSVSSAPGEEGVIAEPASFAWDLATGLYYKANGKPWRLAKLTEGTCYIGINFFRYLRTPDQDMQTSMAQVFTHSGDGFVLRGTEVKVEKGSQEAFLTEAQARALLRDVVEKYTAKTGPPQRIVIHKTSGFSDEEKRGFLDVIQEVPYDFVTIKDLPPGRFFRLGDYPVLRGTLIKLAQRQYLLYTGGFTPRVRTYPGRRVPKPLHLIHDGCSEVKLIANEIMGLTKLNWNTTQFATNFPITLEFARRVAKVLSELEEGAKVQDHYRFYM